MDRPKRAVALDDDLVIAVTAKIIADPEMNAEVALERIIAFRDATRTWWSLGTAVLAIEGKRFWTGYSPAQLGVPGEPFKSLRDFITRVLGKGRATTYRARRCRAILDAMGRDNALEVTQQNALWLCLYAERMGSGWNCEEFLSKAKSYTEADFGKWINDKMGGAAKEEAKKWFRAELTESLAGVIDEFIDVNLWEMEFVHGMTVLGRDISGALENGMSDWLDSWCGVEGYDQGVSHRTLYLDHKSDFQHPDAEEQAVTPPDGATPDEATV